MPSKFKVLFLGDIVGRRGRKVVKSFVAKVRKEYELIIANAENASGGLGLNAKNAWELKKAGIDILTSGNHIWKFKDIIKVLETEEWILRPLNYPLAPGRGFTFFSLPQGGEILVINLQGRTFMEAIDCPFLGVDRLLEELNFKGPVIVDFHAEATSEKVAMGYFLAGRVSGVLGTHTHVQTNDCRILDGFTAYISDVGMCGPVDSVLGMEKSIIIERFLSKRPQKFDLAKGKVKVCGLSLTIDRLTGRCENIAFCNWEEENDSC